MLPSPSQVAIKRPKGNDVRGVLTCVGSFVGREYFVCRKEPTSFGDSKERWSFSLLEDSHRSVDHSASYLVLMGRAIKHHHHHSRGVFYNNDSNWIIESRSRRVTRGELFLSSFVSMHITHIQNFTYFWMCDMYFFVMGNKKQGCIWPKTVTFRREEDKNIQNRESILKFTFASRSREV